MMELMKELIKLTAAVTELRCKNDELQKQVDFLTKQNEELLKRIPVSTLIHKCEDQSNQLENDNRI